MGKLCDQCGQPIPHEDGVPQVGRQLISTDPNRPSLFVCKPCDTAMTRESTDVDVDLGYAKGMLEGLGVDP